MKSGIAVLFGMLALQNAASATVSPNTATISFDLAGISINVIDTDLNDGITPTFEWTSIDWSAYMSYSYAPSGQVISDQYQTSSYSTNSLPSNWQESLNSPVTTAEIDVTATTATLSTSSTLAYYPDPYGLHSSGSGLWYTAQYSITGKAIVEFSLDYSIDASINTGWNCFLTAYCNSSIIEFNVTNNTDDVYQPFWGTELFWSYGEDVFKSYSIDGNFTYQIVNGGDFLTGTQTLYAGANTFSYSTMVPEPAEWSMLLAGLAILRLTLLRVKRKQ